MAADKLRQMLEEQERAWPWHQRISSKIETIRRKVTHKVNVHRKRLLGINTVIGTACKCSSCNMTNYMYRAACRCWPADQWFNSSDEYSMEYGAYVVLPDNSKTVFQSNNDLRQSLESGGKYEDIHGNALKIDDLDGSNSEK